MVLSCNIRLRRVVPLIQVGFLALAALLLAANPVLAGGRTHISSCTKKPYIISKAGSYVLTENLSTTGDKDCIVVEVGSVTIDFDGFAITGSKVAVHGRNSRGVTILNGTIRLAASDGIVLGNNGIVNNMQVNVNFGNGIVCAIHCIITDNTVNSNGSQGIQVLAAATIVNNTVSYNGRHGIVCRGDRFSAAECKISGNTVTLNGQSVLGGSGILAGSQSVIEDNTVNGNFDEGVVASSSTVSGNAVNSNGKAGVRATNGSVLSGNTANFNGKASSCTPLGGGITVVRPTDCGVDLGGNLAIGNTASGNAGYGIDFGGDTTNGYENNVAFNNNATQPPTVTGQINHGSSLGNNLCNGSTAGC